MISEVPSLRAIKDRFRVLRNLYPVVEKRPSHPTPSIPSSSSPSYSTLSSPSSKKVGGANLDLGLELGSRGSILQRQGKSKGGKYKEKERKGQRVRCGEWDSCEDNNDDREADSSRGVKIKREENSFPEEEDTSKRVKIKRESGPSETEDGDNTIGVSTSVGEATTALTGQQNKRRVAIAAPGWHALSKSTEAVAKRIKKRRSVVGSGEALGSVGSSGLDNGSEDDEDETLGLGSKWASG